VNFLTWLFDELDGPSKVSRFAKIVYDDINNGCGDRKWGPVQWRDHFIAEHPDSAGNLNSMLSIAYAQYVMSRSEKKRTL
jgi:hypothetical protein